LKINFKALGCGIFVDEIISEVGLVLFSRGHRALCPNH